MRSDRHLVANFGTAVPLGDTQHMFLDVTNRTPMATSVRAWLDTFGVDDVSKLTGRTELALRATEANGMEDLPHRGIEA